PLFPRPAHYSSSFVFSSHTPAPPDISTLSLHDALPISARDQSERDRRARSVPRRRRGLECGGRRSAVQGHRPDDHVDGSDRGARSEEHTSELQSLTNLVCRLLLEKKNNIIQAPHRASTD